MELLNSIRAEGLGAILGTEHEGLRKRFLHSPSQRWLDETCAKHGVKSEPRSNLAHLIDAWMVSSMKDAEFFDLVLPVLRKQPAAGIDLLSDDEALAVWRSAFTPVIEYAASISSAPVPVALARAVTRKTTTTVQSVREILKAHYGASVIDALERHDKLSIYADAGELPQSVQQRYSMSALDKVVGVTVDGNVGLVANMLTPVMVPGVFLHEVGEHAGLSKMLGDDYGRVVREFNRLLHADDTYAKQAAMRVPADTPARHVPSERLAYMVESVANDRQARRGGAGGYRLGQQCLSSLRTWLFRTPTFRWLESAGELEHFTLSPQDIAGLAREAVNHFANTVEPDVAGELNKWRNTLAEDDLLALSKMEASPRHDALAAMADERLVGYLYSLVVLGVPGIEDSVELFTERLAELAAGKETDSEQPIQDVAAAVLLEAGFLRNRAAIANQVEEVGYSVWVDGTSSPVQATVSVLEKSHANGGYRVASSTVGSGAIQERVFVSLGDAVSAATASSFVASTLEAPDMMRKWADYEHSIGERLGSRAFDEWFDKSQVVDETTGAPLVLYHGTASDFEKFDAAKHRTVLNDKYQGDGFHFTASPSVASTYADANRNNSFNKAAIFASVEREYPGRIADVFKAVVNLGYSRAWEMSDEEIRATLDEAATAGVDLNDLLDLARCVEGTRYHAGRQDHGGFELFELFNGGSGEGLIGDQDRDSAVTLGLEDALPNPLVMPVFLSAKNVLRTDDRAAAKAAQSNGYDGVYYSGPDTVAGEPEWVVFSPDQIKSAIGFTGKPVPAIGSIRQRESLTPQLAFNQWFDGSVIVDKSGEPLVVYHGTEADFTAFADGPAFFSPRWDYSYIRNASFVMPVYLSIKKPYRPSNQSEIEQIRSNPDRLAELKAEGYDGMIWAKQGDLMRGPSGWGNDLPQIVTFYPEQVKSATGNRGAFDAQDADIRFTFAGALAKSAIHADLEQAKQLADAGAEAEAIQVQTGWHAGVDGKWRFEIDDSQASLVDGWEVVRGDAGEVDGAQVFKMIGNLGDELVQLHPIMAEKLGITESISHGILEHPALFKAYPELASISVELRKCDGYPFAARGYFNTAARRIYLEINESRGGSVIGALIHEIQHAVQSVEGFARGGSPDEFRAEITRPRKLEELKAKITALEEANPELAKIKRQMRRQYIRLENKYGTNDTLTDWDSVPESEREEYFALVSTAQSFDEFFALADLEDEINRLFSQENSDQSASEQYRRLAGEIEARNSESRFNLTSEQRRSSLATKTADRKAEEAIVVWDGVVMALDGELVEGLIKTDTQSFKNWFDGSKAVDANAEPLVLYHGTRGDFSSFDGLRTGSASDAGWFGAGFYLTPNPEEAAKYAEGEGGNVMPVYAALKNPYDWRAENERGLFQNNPAHSGEKTKELIEAGHDGVFVYEDSFGLMPGQSLTDEQWSVLIKSGPKLLRVIGREAINQRFREKVYSYQSIVEAYGKEVAAVLPRIRTLKEVVVFRPEQIKSVLNRGSFDPTSPDIRFRAGTTKSQFDEWFGESKLVDAAGKPLVLYHGTNKDFSVFDRSKSERSNLGEGFYFTPDPAKASGFAGTPFNKNNANVMPVYVSLVNPAIVRGADTGAERAGHDGIIRLNDEGEIETVVVFRPEQIKSAVGNNGNFDPASPDIRFREEPIGLGFESWSDDSVLTDAEGDPVVVYHGTKGNLTTVSGDVFWVTPSSELAATLNGGKRKPVGLFVKAKAVFDPCNDDHVSKIAAQMDKRFSNSSFFDWRRRIKDHWKVWDYSEARACVRNAGFDAIYSTEDGIQTIALIGNLTGRVKSASGNNGDFDPSNADIRFREARNELGLINWFGESKIVNADGTPKVMFHKTFADFTVFDSERVGENDYGYAGAGFYFMPVPMQGFTYGDRTMPVYLSIQNPYVRTATSWNTDPLDPYQWIPANSEKFGGDKKAASRAWTAMMRAQGYDGFIDNATTNGEVVAFDNTQIKSAIGNNGLFDASNPDIRFSAAQKQLGFDSWFSDSKVVDASGKPLMVYHGTGASFGKFEASRGNGHYFTDDKDAASAFAENADGDEYAEDEAGSNVVPVYLSINNPLILDSKWQVESMTDEDGEWDWGILDNALYDAEVEGHDGAILRGFMDFAGLVDGKRTERQYDQYIAFRPEQIKSAIGNNGGFDPTNPDIRFSTAPQKPDLDSWFADSQVVGDDGKPRVVYHGTNADFDEFVLPGKKTGQMTGGRAIFFSESPETANYFARYEGGRVIPAYIRLVKPFDFRDESHIAEFEPYLRENFDTIAPGALYGPDAALILVKGGDYGLLEQPKVISWMKRKGFDGIRLVERPGADTYAVFRPDQIRFAIGGSGLSEASKPDIRFRAADQANQTESEQFKAWFGDWRDPKAFSSRAAGPVSYAVSDTGAPLVLYHATNADFNVFEPGRSTVNSTTFGDMETERHGIFASPSASFSEEYLRAGDGQNLMPIFMSIKSPLDMREGISGDAINDIVQYSDAEIVARDFYHVGTAETWQFFDGDFGRKFVAAAQKAGYDGAILTEASTTNPDASHEVYVAFSPAQIKSALGNNGDFNPSNPDIRFSFAGAGAETANRTSLEQAKLWQEQGEPSEFIRRETGWFLGADSKWRFEIDDSNAVAKDNWSLWGQNKTAVEFKLADLIEHWALFDAYPHMRSVAVLVTPEIGAGGAIFHGGPGITPSISLFAEKQQGQVRLSAEQLSVIQHELQHVIQQYEGFASGGSPADVRPTSFPQDAIDQLALMRSEYDALSASAFELRSSLSDLMWDVRKQAAKAVYLSLAGEVEARNVQARLAMTQDERIATSPLSTQDTDIADQVIIWNGQMMHREPVADADSEAADLGALAQFLSQDDDYQFYNFQEREDIYDRLIARRMADEQFAGMALPASFGSVLITRSAKQEGAWQVTSFDAKGQPSSDDGIQSKEQALRTFFEYANPSLADQQLVEIASASVKAGKGFDNWFGASKVVRPDGSPQVVYHGTSADFDVFHVDHKGVFFTANPDVARPYSMMRSGTPNTIPAFLSIQNPWTLIQYADDVPYIHQVDQTPTALKAQGYDGILCPNESGRGDVWIAFEATQIKSAIGNNGDFDPSNPDIRFRESIADDVMEQAALVSAAENEEATAKSLDMSHAARIERAKAMGFDTETVWYHGTESAGFSAFDAEGKRGTKTEGAGAFFTNSRAMAASYSPSNQDAPVFTGQELFDDPDLADGSVEIESAWVFMDSRGRVTETWASNQFGSADQILAAEEFELEDGESLEKRYTVFIEGSHQGQWVSEAEAIEQLGEVELKAPGIYAVYLRTKDILEIDWEGRNWDTGPEETVWDAVDENGDIVNTCYSAAELEEFKAEQAGCSFNEVQQSVYFSADDAARQARQMGFDAVLIKNVEDNGSHGQGSIDGSVMVVFDASNIRLTSAAFDPAFTASADIRLRQADAESRTDVRLGDALVMRDAFKDWFAGSPVVDAAGAPQVMYHGTKKGGDLTSFQPGGTDYETRSGDAYGVASYFTSDPDEASRYAGDAGAVIPVYITGNILDLDHELSAAHAAQLTAFANRVILPSDRARFGMSQRTEKFANTSQARSFYEAKMEEWKALGDRMDRAKPEADKDGDQLVVRYIDFTSPIEIKSGQDAKVLFGAIGWDNVRPAGFDGVLMTRDGGAQWAVMHNPAGTVKSVFNLGSFNRGTPDIRFSTTEPVGALAVLRDGTPVPESGKPVAYYYGKNLAKAPAMGALYMQDIEPVGDYMVVSPIAMNAVNPVEGWEYGTIEFKSPLVIDAAGALVEWKKKLSDQYQGKTGPALSNAIRKDGYDSIITFDSYGLTETISLGPQRKPGGSLGLTDLPAFKAWFDGSKVAQADGTPKVVYHGARPSEDAEAITEFDRLFMVKERGRRVSQDNVGLWFTENNGARGVDLYSGGDRVHGGVVYPVYLSIKHPWEVSFSGMKRTANRLLGRERDTKMDEEAVEAVRAWMIENERDGVRLVHDPRDGDEFAHQQVWVALEPEQIKSAIGNSGEFGQSSPDIRFSMDSSSAVPESTRDASFKKWFGLSKAVGKSGEPLVMYHGTLADFSEFSTESIKSRHSFSFGFHFTDRPGEASAYTDHLANRANNFDPNHPHAVPPMEGGNVMPVYLRAENPLVVTTTTQSASMVADLDKASIISQLLDAKRAGNPYDSVMIKSERGDEWDGVNVIVFDPTQIKSAIGNNGDFDPANPDIRFSMAAEALPDHPFKGFTRAQFLGAPKITSDSNAADLRPSSGNSLIDVVPEAFVSVRGGLTAKYSKMAGAVFDGNKVIASYSFGDTLVVDKKYRREGIGAELVYQWRMRFPESKTAETRTKKSQALMEKVWSRVAGEVSASDRSAASALAGADQIMQGESEVSPFSEWFGESKIVDAYGKPLVVYHGTAIPKTAFRREGGAAGVGAYFTPLRELAEDYAEMDVVDEEDSPHVMEVYLSINNPYRSTGIESHSITEERRDQLESLGYDGVISEDGNEIVAFRPEQIKSAIGNNGQYDPADPDIRFSVAAEEVAPASDQMDTPKTMYRSVSPHEWEQIKADGVIRGGLNAFNPWDSRREVFFGDALTDQLIAQGEDIIRRAEYMVQSSPINAAFKNKQSELLSIGSLIANAASKLGFASREDMPGFMFNSNKTLKGLRQREKVVEVEIDALRESARAQINATAAELRREDAERGYSSVVIETRPISGGRVYSGQSSGMGNEPEYGFQSGSVLLEDVVSIRFVSGRKVLSSQAWQDGKPISAFDDWFSGSKAVNPDGSPMLAYHGTGADTGGVFRPLTFFSSDPAIAAIYAAAPTRQVAGAGAGPNVTPVFLSIKNPFEFDERVTRQVLSRNVLGRRASLSEVAEELMRRGHDSIILRNYEDLGGVQDQFVIFDSAQAKSAVGNQGSFSPNDPDIRFRIADEEIQTAKVGTRAFEQWFSSSVTRDSQGKPEVMYHGTVEDFTEFNSEYIWASATPALANDYAEMRSETTQKPASVMPVYLRAVAPFDADKAKHLNRMSSFFREMEAQARGAGREFDQELVASLLATVLAEARKEESGPYYNVQDIWNASSMRFGQTGAEAIKQAFNALGFDSIKFTEHGQTTVGVLEPWQVKSALGNAGFFDAASADVRCCLAKTEGQAGFNLWNEGNYAVDGEGRPLLVFRGEHGVAEGVFQSRIGSLSFGNLETAVHYALNPNDRREQVREPRLIPAYLTIKNPVMADANDPFIDLSLIAAAVGYEKARQIAVDLEPLILSTSYFEGVKCDSLDSYLTDHPSALGDLYVDAFHVFDSHEYVEWFRQAGFDGAVHCGAGASMQTAEYKVFSPEQVIAATPIAVPSTHMSPRYVEAFCDVVRQLAPVVDVGHVGGSLSLSGAADSQFVLSMASGDSDAPREAHSITPICAATGLRSM